MFGQMAKKRLVSTALPGPTSLVPAAFAGRAAGIDHLRAAGVAMRDQHGIVAVRRERAQRPVGDRHVRHYRAALQAEILDGEVVWSRPVRNLMLSCIIEPNGRATSSTPTVHNTKPYLRSTAMVRLAKVSRSAITETK